MESTKEDVTAANPEQGNRRSDHHLQVTRTSSGEQGQNVLAARAAKDLNNSKFDLDILEDEDEDDIYDGDNDGLDAGDIISGVLVILGFFLSILALAMVLSGPPPAMAIPEPSGVRAKRGLSFEYLSIFSSKNMTVMKYLSQRRQFVKPDVVVKNTLSNCFYHRKISSLTNNTIQPYTELRADVSLKNYAMLGFGCGIEKGHTLRNLFRSKSKKNRGMSLLCIGYGTSSNYTRHSNEQTYYQYTLSARFMICPITDKKGNLKLISIA